MTYDLYQSYPNLERVKKGYYLRGINRYPPNSSLSPSTDTSLWFQYRGNGLFKQFDTMPFRECHWDLLRWTPGSRGVLRYLSTSANCYSDHTQIRFKPGIAYMPRTWAAGERWSDSGVSSTAYSENGIPVCEGVDTWRSRVVGLAKLTDGTESVHTQTDETQTLSPVAGAPNSASCPGGQATAFSWQENFYVDATLRVKGGRGTDGFDVGLARSVGGNINARHGSGHPSWDSMFGGWAPLPSRNVGALSTTTTGAIAASGEQTLTFTYTAPPGGMRGGVLRLDVPTGWTLPVTTNTPGCTVASSGTLATSGQTIILSNLNLSASGRLTITYGAVTGGSCQAGDQATASATPGAPVWQVEAQERSADAPTSLPSSPVIDVEAPRSSNGAALPAPPSP